MCKVAILTVSDRCSAGQMQDETGKVVRNVIESMNLKIVSYDVVKDDRGLIKERLLNYCDEMRADIVLTNGGTGFSCRDVTPEATRDIIERDVPGIPELMRKEGGRLTEKAYLSRAVSGIKGSTLIINLPGSPKGAEESLNAIKGMLIHSVEMIKGKGHH